MVRRIPDIIIKKLRIPWTLHRRILVLDSIELKKDCTLSIKNIPMKLSKLKPTWQYFKVVNGLETLERTDILSIIDTAEKVDYQVNNFSLLPYAMVLGLFLLFFQSC